MAAKKTRIRRVLWMGALLALLGGGGWLIYQDYTAPKEVDTVLLREGPMEEYVEDRGRTTLPHIYHITMPQQGRVLPITLQEGAKVTKGQVLARLEDADLQDALKESASIVKAMADTVRSAQAQVKASKARRSYLKWLAETREKLYKSKAISEKLMREAKTEYLESSMDTEGDEALSYAYSAVSSASKLLPIFIQRNLKRTAVESPSEGVVLKRYVWNTKVLQGGEPLLDVGNLEEIQITAPILTEEAVRIASGDEVSIFGETLGSSPLKGRVVRVKPQGYTKVSSLGVEQQRVDVVIAFGKGELERLQKEEGRALGLEYRVHVHIVTARKEKALTAPRTALFRNAGNTWSLFVVRQGKAEEVPVELGMQNHQEVEILKGVQPGERVILTPDEHIIPGLRVRSEGTSS